MEVGIMDANLRGRRNIEEDHTHYIGYDGGGKIQGDGRLLVDRSGEGFKSRDIVTVIVHKSEGKIEWEVNDKKVFAYEMMRLRISNIKWVPYIVMYDVDDQIEWM